jgi:hypothetical protein
MATSSSEPIKPGVAAQRYLDIAEIREDLVILKDGTLRAVLLVSSINFALKSMDEQNAIVQGYMQFLNGIDFPIQVVIQSRKMNIDNYLRQLRENEKTQQNDLLKGQIRDYTEFIQQLVKIGDIMQKRFYVVIPYNPSAMVNGNVHKTFSERISQILLPSCAPSAQPSTKGRHRASNLACNPAVDIFAATWTAPQLACRKRPTLGTCWNSKPTTPRALRICRKTA